MDEYFDFDNRELFEELIEQLRRCEYERGVLQRCCEAYQYTVEKQAEELKEAQAEANRWKGLFAGAVRTQERMAVSCEKLAEKVAYYRKKGGRGDE